MPTSMSRNAFLAWLLMPSQANLQGFTRFSVAVFEHLGRLRRQASSIACVVPSTATGQSAELPLQLRP